MVCQFKLPRPLNNWNPIHEGDDDFAFPFQLSAVGAYQVDADFVQLIRLDDAFHIVLAVEVVYA